MSDKFRKILSRCLIGAGVLILLGVGGFELVNYPWDMQLAEMGLIEAKTVADIPDPAPLPRHLLDMQPEQPQTEEPQELMEAPAIVLERPKVALTYLGIIKIPKISVSENIISGTGKELYYGVGHVVGTPMPGQAGNCVLAAHRNHILAHAFRHLDKLSVGDEIYLTTNVAVGEDGVYSTGEDVTVVYEVYNSFVVEPTETWVMASQPGETHMLTLITCTPSINPTHRLIIFARLKQ